VVNEDYENEQIKGHSNNSDYPGKIPNECTERVQIIVKFDQRRYLTLDRVDFSLGDVTPKCPDELDSLKKSFEHATANAIKAIVHQIKKQQQ